MDRLTQLLGLLEDEPRDSFLRHAAALEYIKKGDDANALQQFELLLGNDPDYVGSYYHLAKLYERTNKDDLAIATYEKGMLIARHQNHQHALGELRSALEELTM